MTTARKTLWRAELRLNRIERTFDSLSAEQALRRAEFEVRRHIRSSRVVRIDGLPDSAIVVNGDTMTVVGYINVWEEP